MSREILFRGKRVDNGEWVEGYYAHFESINRYYIFTGRRKLVFISEIVEMPESYEVDSSTVCQYTGLTDKNGKKIWENDIIKYHFGDVYAPIKFGTYQSCFDSQKTAHEGFYVDWESTSRPNMRKDLGYWVNMVDTEICGNSFDNSELLEGEHE